jgi:hypothetical protein
MRRTALPVLGILLLLARVPRPAHADDRLPGEAVELTDKVRAEAQQHLDRIAKGGEDAVKSRRALIVLGPAVWPVVENAMRLTPSEETRPHLMLLKALLARKAEPEFEALRGRLRRKVLMDDMPGVFRELTEFRAGRPDPARKGARIPPQVPSAQQGRTTVFRSSDGSIVLGFGGDGTAKEPDAPQVSLSDGAAGIVAAVGGKALPFARRSGKGADVSVSAPNGFAWAWAGDGAPGQAPGGMGGDGGGAQAKGGAGEFAHSGTGGAGAPGDSR